MKRLGFWNRLYLVLAGVVMIVAPIVAVFVEDAQWKQRSASWIDYCGKTYLGTRSDYEEYHRCTRLFSIQPGPDWGLLMVNVAVTTALLAVILWALIRIGVALARWVRAGRASA